MPDAVNTLRTHILVHEYGVLQQTCLSKRRASGKGCNSQRVQGREPMQKLTATHEQAASCSKTCSVCSVGKRHIGRVT
jgi:hypothetical protein